MGIKLIYKFVYFINQKYKQYIERQLIRKDQWWHSYLNINKFSWVINPQEKHQLQIDLCLIHSIENLGIDFISKTLYYEDRTIRLKLWDTAGQERFRSLIPSYIRDSAVSVVCYDVQGQQILIKWIEDVRLERGNDVIIFIVANKIDLENRAVNTEEGANFVKEYDAHFIEVSAKTGSNVELLFKQIAATLPATETSQMINSVVNNPNQSNAVKLDNQQVQEQDKKDIKSCC